MSNKHQVICIGDTVMARPSEDFDWEEAVVFSIGIYTATGGVCWNVRFADSLQGVGPLIWGIHIKPCDGKGKAE